MTCRTELLAGMPSEHEKPHLLLVWYQPCPYIDPRYKNNLPIKLFRKAYFQREIGLEQLQSSPVTGHIKAVSSQANLIVRGSITLTIWEIFNVWYHTKYLYIAWL